MPFLIPESRDEIAKIQSERKKIALQKARRAKFHQGRLDNIDEDRLDDPDEWRKIPLLTKDELRAIPPENFFDDFCHAPREDIAELWRSGGSTGIPLFYPRTFEDMKYGVVEKYRRHGCASVAIGLRMAERAFSIERPGPRDAPGIPNSFRFPVRTLRWPLSAARRRKSDIGRKAQ